MACKIIIDAERCKGCRLCVDVCPKGSIGISKRSNKNGYFPAEITNSHCTGCAMCAIICPETIIEVYRDSRVVALPQVALPQVDAKSNNKIKPALIREKT